MYQNEKLYKKSCKIIEKKFKENKDPENKTKEKPIKEILSETSQNLRHLMKGMMDKKLTRYIKKICKEKTRKMIQEIKREINDVIWNIWKERCNNFIEQKKENNIDRKIKRKKKKKKYRKRNMIFKLIDNKEKKQINEQKQKITIIKLTEGFIKHNRNPATENFYSIFNYLSLNQTKLNTNSTSAGWL